MKTLNEMLVDKGMLSCEISILQAVFREWLKQVEIPQLYDEERDLLIALVDEP